MRTLGGVSGLVGGVDPEFETARMWQDVGCVPPERTFPINANAFSEQEWASLQMHATCDDDEAAALHYADIAKG